jgi:hypothetical protein
MRSGDHRFDDLAPPNLSDILKLVLELNRRLENITANGLYNVWLPKKTVMRFFDYGETQMRQIERDFGLETSKIRARKFYSTQSILNLIEKHKNTKNEQL